VRIPLRLERGEAALVVTVGVDGLLFGLQLVPGGEVPPVRWEPPAYADASLFSEEDLLLGAGPLAVPGTLSLPRAPKPCAAVVLLGGSGPVDRDSTLGPNKPFKDLAWGLASRGVAVLRFDKVTFAHPDDVEADTGFTVADEYLVHAGEAIRLLADHPAIDPGRVFVLGHSLGGTVAPRVAEAEKVVAGLVILAGGTVPLHRAIVRQVKYLASLIPETSTESGPAIDVMVEQARLVDSPDLSVLTPASGLPFGVPAPYWLDLRGYAPAAVAAGLGKPMLILQGGRDYQVTVADDLPAWQEALAGRPDVTVRIYDAGNHLFFTGTGLSTPADYDAPQHMDVAVVEDVARWITSRGAEPAS